MTEETEGAAPGDTAGNGMRIDADLVRHLAELLNTNDLTEIEVEDGNRRISVKRQVTMAPAAHYAAPAPAAAPAAAAPAAAPLTAAQQSAADDVANAANPDSLKSPMVGTAYLSSEPGARPFVSPGSAVKEGETVLIIEAMKVMNPIVATRSGTVRSILVQDGQPVEYDQPLVIVE